MSPGATSLAPRRAPVLVGPQPGGCEALGEDFEARLNHLYVEERSRTGTDLDQPPRQFPTPAGRGNAGSMD